MGRFFYKKSLNMGPVFYKKKSLNLGAIFLTWAQISGFSHGKTPENKKFFEKWAYFFKKNP